MPSKEIAEKHSMDVPHVAAIEVPFIVKNMDKVISMLGGKQKIAQAIDSQNKPSGNQVNSLNDKVLELRLRDDPFHHPIQALVNNCEKIVLKVSIPKKSIPNDYKDNPLKYTVRDLIEINSKEDGPKHKVQPVAIIDKTYSFKAMSDFQAVTKNNKMIQEFKDSCLNTKNYNTLFNYFDQNESFTGISDFKKSDWFKNDDHQLPPPPVFSPIRFPFDYKYQKNPLTTAVKDAESGQIKLISRKETLKLHTIIIDFHSNTPNEADPTLMSNLKELRSSNLDPNSLDYLLLGCIDWLKSIFSIKPIWLRKHLEDLASYDFKRVLKQALPYVSYIYKSGPWRFCNIQFGVDPKLDKAFWVYQSEYFRIPNLQISLKLNNNQKRIVPLTLTNKSSENIKISETLFFNGQSIPSTVTYQVGDISDPVILKLLESHMKEFGNDFFREYPDFQDGWLNKQTIETIRRVVRYKLGKIVKEAAIESSKVDKLINTDYREHTPEEEFKDAEDTEMDIVHEEHDGGDEDLAILEEDEHVHERDGEDEDGEEENARKQMDENLIDDQLFQNEDEIKKKFSNSDDPVSNVLNELVGFIKQDSLNST